MMWSVYVDDSNIVDFRTAKGSGQHLGMKGFQLLGTPFAPNKSKTMNTSNDHLGVVTDLANAISKCSVEFWPRQSLCDKAKGMIQTFKTNNYMSPASSSKFRGIVGFTSTAMAYHVGRAGMHPLKQRQYSDHPPYTLSHSLRRSLDFHDLLLSSWVRRELSLEPSSEKSLLLASDAQADTAPTGGYIA